ncbi:DUF6046 domain-containing protein [uncultured Microscilla sp.]|uniref:DUF6046 domain-containing protein n=1 Tax=uncultured Microscilla sp. TaxID=432653 RepID=UPI002625B168|nr:DUF6046 domain-containing protein [uncultured Microscilla sp.]
MAIFDATKFLNFYGFVPNALDHIRGNSNKLPVRTAKSEGASQDNRPQNPLDAPNGKPLISGLTLKWGASDKSSQVDVAETQEQENNNTNSKEDKNNQYIFEIPPVITVNLKKNVVTTKIAGSSRPPVVEIIGYDTFSVKIQGYVENVEKHALVQQTEDKWWAEPATTSELAVRDDRFPKDKLAKLIEVFEQNEALTAESEILKLFNITRIVITSMPEVTYYPTAFTYSFSAVADAHQEILVLED